MPVPQDLFHISAGPYQDSSSGSTDHCFFSNHLLKIVGYLAFQILIRILTPFVNDTVITP